MAQGTTPVHEDVYQVGKYPFSKTDLRKAHQMTVERSLHYLCELDNETVEGGGSNSNPFASTKVEKFCKFSRDQNKNLFADFGSIDHHLQCLSDVSLVRYVSGHQKQTNQKILVRFDAYTSENSARTSGIDPKLRSERSHRNLVRHFISWKETLELPDLFKKGHLISVNVVCSVTAAPDVTLETLIGNGRGKWTVQKGLAISKQLADFIKYLRKGFFNHNGVFVANEIGPIHPSSLFVDKPDTCSSILKVANLKLSRRWEVDADAGNSAKELFIPNRLDALNLAGFILTVTLSTVRGISLNEAECVSCCVLLEVLIRVRLSKPATGYMWETILRHISGAADVTDCLRKCFAVQATPEDENYSLTIDTAFYQRFGAVLAACDCDSSSEVLLERVSVEKFSEFIDLTVETMNNLHPTLLQLPTTRAQHSAVTVKETDTLLIFRIVFNIANLLVVTLKPVSDSFILRCLARLLLGLGGQNEVQSQIQEKLDSQYKQFSSEMIEVTKYMEMTLGCVDLIAEGTSSSRWDSSTERTVIPAVWRHVAEYLQKLTALTLKLPWDLPESEKPHWTTRLTSMRISVDIICCSLLYLTHMRQMIGRYPEMSLSWPDSLSAYVSEIDSAVIHLQRAVNVLDKGFRTGAVLKLPLDRVRLIR